MRLLTIGTLKGQLAAAAKIAADKSASAIHADCIDIAMAMLRSGKGADLLMVDIAIDIHDLVVQLETDGFAHRHEAQQLSKRPAKPWPPPMHIVTMP